jgi:hypothetical protein
MGRKIISVFENELVPKRGFGWVVTPKPFDLAVNPSTTPSL